MRTCYLEKGEDGTAAEVHMIGAFGKPAIGIVKVDDKSTHNRGFVEVLMTDINDDAEKPNYRRTGYLSFDTDATVDQYGYIYKQIKEMNTQIENLQKLLKSQQDRYIKQFSGLEEVISKWNTQSSVLDSIYY